MLYLLQLERQGINGKGENNVEVLDMNELELKEQAIKEFVNLQRVKTAENKEKEIEYQERVLKARLQALGIPTEDLELK